MFNLSNLTGKWMAKPKTLLAQSASRTNSPANEHRLMVSLLEEYIRSASLCITATSVANAFAEKRQVRLFGSLHIYMPTEPTVFSAIASNLVATALDPRIASDLEDYYAATQVATIKTLEACGGLRPIRLATAVDWPILLKDWHWACRLASLVSAERLMRSVGEDAMVAERLVFMRDSARAAVQGQCPNIASDGTVVIPGLLDRRRDQRLRVGRPVWIESNAGRQHATLQDISASGMGLAFCRALKPGMPVTTILPSGRRMLGITVWACSERAGVRFVSPLLETDPILTSTSL